MRIAITGGIGAGKSYVCRLLSNHGIEIYDCDNGAKRLMRTSHDLQQRLSALIGPDTFIDGQLNKTRVSEFLLASEDNKQAINAIVHPAVIQDFYDSGLLWMESAILYEAHLEHNVDKVICVIAPEDIRIARIMQRDNITETQAREWIHRQMPQDETARRADYVIINDGTTDLEKQITNIIENINNNRKYK